MSSTRGAPSLSYLSSFTHRLPVVGSYFRPTGSSPGAKIDVGKESRAVKAEVCTHPYTFDHHVLFPIPHFWLKITNADGTVLEAGLGPTSGKIPTVDGNFDLPGTPVAVIPHSGVSEKLKNDHCHCVPIEKSFLAHLAGDGIDPEALKKNLQAAMGKPHGVWSPWDNCATTVLELFAKSKFPQRSTPPPFPAELDSVSPPRT